MIGTSALRALVGAGLSPQQILTIVEAIEADARPKDRGAAERQARRRQRLKAKEGAGPDTKGGVTVAESGVTASVIGGVTGAVTGGVTCDSASASPLDENISNPPTSTQAPKGVSPLPAAGKRARASRLPDDFVMPDEWKDWARAQRGWAVETIATEAENFADYWQARATGATKRDWRKAWQNWVRNSKRPDGAHRDAMPRSPEAQAQAAAEHAARLERIGRAEDAALIRRRWATGPPRSVADCLTPGIGTVGAIRANGTGETYTNGRK